MAFITNTSIYSQTIYDNSLNPYVLPANGGTLLIPNANLNFASASPLAAEGYIQIIPWIDPPINGTQLKGAWSSATAYVAGNVVSYNGVMYYCTLANTNITPVVTTNPYWQQTLFGGATGPAGINGTPGPANTLTIGTVNSGSSAAAIITGTSPTQVLNLTLPIGPAGPSGNDGVNGTTLRYGTGAPISGIGLNGDFYIDDAAWEVYGPKASGVWPAGVSLIGPTGPSGGGTVTSVAMTVPTEYNISGSPITGAGTLSMTKANQTANLVYAGPSSGSPTAPSFRGLVQADTGNLYGTSGATLTLGGNTTVSGAFATTLTVTGTTNLTLPTSGTVTALGNAVTGSGNIVLATSPTLTTPSIGAATGTSLSVSGSLTSTASTGTAPLVVTSTTPVTNLDLSFTQTGTGSVARSLKNKLTDFVSVLDFGAKGDGTTDDTAAFNAALLAHLKVYVPATSAGYKITGTINMTQTGQALIGDGRFATVLNASTASTPLINVSTGINNVEIAYMSLNRSTTATAGGHGILCSSIVNFCRFHDLYLQGHYDGIFLGPTGFSSVENTTVMNCQNIGLVMQNATGTGGGQLQWSLMNTLVEGSGSHGYYISGLGTTSQPCTLGTYVNVATFANTGYGMAVLGSSTSPVSGLRLRDSYLGGDGGSELYLDTYAAYHTITDSLFELAGTGPTGPTSSTAASNVGNGILITTNNTNVGITGCTIIGNSNAGVNSSSTYISIGSSLINNNGVSTTQPMGILLLAGTGSISNNQIGNISGTSQAYGVYLNADLAISITGNNLTGNATSPVAGAVTLTQYTYVGNIPTSGPWLVRSTLTAPTLTASPTQSDSSTLVASTAFVQTAVNGGQSISVAGGSNVTLTAAQAVAQVFTFTGALTANINVIVPTAYKTFVVENNTTGAFTLTVKTSAGTGILVTQGHTQELICDGTNVLLASNDLVGAGIASLAANTFSGAQALGNNSLTGIRNAYFNAEYGNGNSGTGTVSITWTNGQCQNLTLTGTCTISVGTPPGVGHYQLRLIQNGTGGFTVTWSGLSSSRWLGSTTAPALNTAANGESIVNLYFDGTNITQSMSHTGAV